jgi:glucose-6-phosphate isomerase
MSNSIQVDLSRSGCQENSLSNQDCSLADDLKHAHQQVCSLDLELMASGEIPDDRKPLDGKFYSLPDNILSEYRTDRDESELGQILKTANRLQSSVEAIVVLGIGGSYMGTRALMDACCEPYYNELSKAERGGRPQLYFAGNHLDNDALQGVLGRLRAVTPEGNWGIIVISKSGETLETAVALRTLLDLLKQQCHHDLPNFVIPITGETGSLNQMAAELGCTSVFRVPEGVGGRFSLFSAVGLLPAATIGLDVVQLLQGAADMNETFRTAELSSNPPLDFALAAYRLQLQGDVSIRVLSVWEQAFASLGMWYDQLLSESLGKDGQGMTPITMVNTRDLHSRAQQHQAGRNDKWIVNLSTRKSHTDQLNIKKSTSDVAGLNDLAGVTLGELSAAARQGTNRALCDVQRPTADIVLERGDEYGLGQFFQMMMLATVVEGKLLGVNPYGQPGVEAYKNHMRNILLSGKS